MRRPASGLTASQEILLAANELATNGKEEFSEWDLTVAAWRRNQNRFGARGYEDRYPDHKRVMMEIMSKTKKDNPVRQGWIEKTRTNYYRLTSLGQAEADRMRRMVQQQPATVRSAQPIYDAVEAFVFHPVFQRFLVDPSEPKTWLGAEAFLGLARYDQTALDDRIRSIRNAASQALRWMDETDQDQLRSGATGGKKAIHRADLAKLPEFLDALDERFKVQMDAIRGRSRTAAG